MKFFDRFRKNKQETTEQVSDKEIEDLYKAEKRSRRVHIGFGIASIFLLGLLAASLLPFGGIAAFTSAFYAINLTLSISAIGCLAGAVISKVINRKNRAKIKLLKEAKISESHTKGQKSLDDKAIQKNKRKFIEDYEKNKKHLSQKQRDYILGLSNDGIDTTSSQEESKPVQEEKNNQEIKDWRKRESVSLSEARDILYDYQLPISNKKLKEEFDTKPQKGKIEGVLLYPEGGKPVSLVNVFETDNDIALDYANLELMHLINKIDSLEKVTIVRSIDDNKKTETKYARNGEKIYSDSEMTNLEKEITAKKTFTR